MFKKLMLLSILSSAGLAQAAQTLAGLALPGKCSDAANFGANVSGFATSLQSLIGKGLVNKGGAVPEGACSVLFSDTYQIFNGGVYGYYLKTCTVVAIGACEINGSNVDLLTTNLSSAPGVGLFSYFSKCTPENAPLYCAH